MPTTVPMNVPDPKWAAAMRMRAIAQKSSMPAVPGAPVDPFTAALAGDAIAPAASAPPPDPKKFVTPNPADSTLAEALLGQANSGQPIETPLELMGRLAQSYTGNKLNRDAEQKKQDQFAGLAEIFAGEKPTSAALFEYARNNRSQPALDMGLRLRAEENKKPELLKFTGPDDAYMDPKTGEVIRPPKAPGTSGGMFRSKSVEAEGLNYLVDNGIITSDQAASVAAGKTITGQNGEIIFMTPQGIFSNNRPVTPAAAEGAAPQPATRGGMIPLTDGKMSDPERAAAGYADRLRSSNELLDELENVGTDLTQTNLYKVPLIGNYLVSTEYQRLDQAKRSFINAQLRRESGAVISPKEFENADLQYFPVPGDDPPTLAQKKAARQEAITNMSRSAGQLYKAPPPAATKPPKPPVQISDDPRERTNQYNNLTKGDRYITPDGTLMEKM